MFWLPAVGRPAAFWPSRHLPIIPPVSAVKSSSCSAAGITPIPGPFDPDHLHAIGPILSPIGQLPRPLRGGVHASSRLRPLVRFDQARRCRPGRGRRAGSQVFDGFSIGSSDLTQPTLGVDRDVQIVAFEFERSKSSVKSNFAAPWSAKATKRPQGFPHCPQGHLHLPFRTLTH